MNAALRHLDNTATCEEIRASMEAVKRVDAYGATVHDTINAVHPAVAAELFWNDYAEDRYTDREISVSGDQYITVLDTLLDAYNSVDEEPSWPRRLEERVRGDPFDQGQTTFNDAYEATDSLDDVYERYDPVTQGVSVGSRLFGSQGIGVGGVILAAQAGQGELGAVFLTGMMTTGLYETYRKEQAWNGFRAARDAVAAERAVQELAETVGDRRVTLRNIPEYDPEKYRSAFNTEENKSTREENLPRIINFVAEHEPDALPDRYAEEYAELLED